MMALLDEITLQCSTGRNLLHTVRRQQVKLLRDVSLTVPKIASRTASYFPRHHLRDTSHLPIFPPSPCSNFQLPAIVLSCDLFALSHPGQRQSHQLSEDPRDLGPRMASPTSVLVPQLYSSHPGLLCLALHSHIAYITEQAG